ncbi:hypothetical protein HDU97_003991 [Phlyctochytrium planicorne]|nr:hypothetical protein HDU97_003991 [Phlyctochytrium planicorne]
MKHLLVLDFEATCGPSVPKEDAEIIEFPIVVVNIESKSIVDSFQTYVRPTIHPTLDPFCTELTGITQDQVDNGMSFPDALAAATQFSKQYWDHKSVFVTCGDWDLRTMLPLQLNREGLTADKIFEKYVNVKTAFGTVYQKSMGKGMTGMLDHLNITLEGRHHSGIDDSRNIAKICIRLMEDGYSF